MNIEKGVSLVCVDDSNQKILKRGKIYTVLELDRGGRVYIEEHKRFSFLIKRFEVVK